MAPSPLIHRGDADRVGRHRRHRLERGIAERDVGRSAHDVTAVQAVDDLQLRAVLLDHVIVPVPPSSFEATSGASEEHAHSNTSEPLRTPLRTVAARPCMLVRVALPAYDARRRLTMDLAVRHAAPVRIGIIGGGVAGLGCAWLLEGAHEVTLFERQTHFGGHARTSQLRIDDADTLVETGFEFFSANLWPSFNRLLTALGVEVREYPVRIAVYRAGQAHTRLLQPMHVDGRFAPSLLTPRRTFDLAQFGLLLAAVAPLMHARDTTPTVAETLARVPLTRAFREEFLWPFLLSGWCVEPDEFRGFSAYNVLRYAYMSLSLRGSIPMREVAGGLRAYVAALLAQIPSAQLRMPAQVARLDRRGGELFVHEQDGRAHAFDQLILATNARDAARLLCDLPGQDGARTLLERIDYFRTSIGVHGDRRFMPADERDWSIVNVRHDGHYAHTTVWKPWRGARVFRSWLSFEHEQPDPLYEHVEFDHPKPTPAYFETQRALRAEQGKDGVWLAGMHTHDIDSHESALCSALNAVLLLAPDAPRLHALRH